MFTRYIIWYIILIGLYSFCFYYILCFSAIFKNSNYRLFIGFLLSIVIDLLLVKFVLISFKCLIIYILKNNVNGILVGFYNIYVFIINFFL